MTIRVSRDRHYVAYPLMRIALDDEVVAKMIPKQSVVLHGNGKPQCMTAWFAGAYSNELNVTDPGEGSTVEVRASFVPRWKQMILWLMRRPVMVYLEVVRLG